MPTTDSPTSTGEPARDPPLELIERRIEELAASIAASSARWIELVGEFDQREGWANTGCRSTAEWVAWRCALNPRAAREHVRVARALRELPQTGRAFARGELSYSKVRAITRIAEPATEERLLDLAAHATAAQLERIVRVSRRVSTAEAAETSEFLRWQWDDDGSLRIDAKLSAAEGAVFLRALEAARDTLYAQRLGEAEEKLADGSAGPLDALEPSGSAEPPAGRRPAVPSPTNAEALGVMSESALARPPTGLPGGERYQVILHVEADSLGRGGPGHRSIADGPSISPETARRLACDASVISLLERDGRPLSVGRRTRTVPPSIRRALVARDGRCQFPGCECRRFVDAHHIRHWSQGGETSLDNLVLLCRRHHRFVHEGGISIDLDERGQPRFRRADGRTIPRAPALSAPPGGRLAPAAGPLRPGDGLPMDLRACVDAVFA